MVKIVGAAVVASGGTDTADIRACLKCANKRHQRALLDHLVGLAEQRRRHG